MITTVVNSLEDSMFKVKKKNALALLLLLITGALGYFMFHNRGNDLALNAPKIADLRDSVAQNSAPPRDPELKLNPTETGELKDSIAQNPADIGSGVGGHGGNGIGNNPGSPRGGSDWNGGIGNTNDFGRNGSHNNGSDISPSGPTLPQ
jgi:hypothetical protein